MKIEEIREGLEKVMMESGIDVSDLDGDEIIDVDSLRYIYLIVQIEEHFSIMIDEDYISNEGISMNGLLDMIRHSI
jgi:acyl carrier protein